MKPTFMAALRISTFRRVRLMSSAAVVVAVLLDFWLDWLKPDRTLDAELHLAFAARLPSVPRTRMLGIEGLLSSGLIGVSSNSVVGVSGR